MFLGSVCQRFKRQGHIPIYDVAWAFLVAKMTSRRAAMQKRNTVGYTALLFGYIKAEKKKRSQTTSSKDLD